MPKLGLVLILMQVSIFAMMIWDSSEFKHNAFVYITPSDNNWMSSVAGFEGWHPVALPVHALNLFIAHESIKKNDEMGPAPVWFMWRAVAASVVTHFVCISLNHASSVSAVNAAASIAGWLFTLIATGSKSPVAYGIATGVFASGIFFALSPVNMASRAALFWVSTSAGLFFEIVIDKKSRSIVTWTLAAATALAAIQYPKRIYLLYIVCMPVIFVLVHQICSQPPVPPKQSPSKSV